MLRDGSTVHVRPVRAQDEEAIREFLHGLSSESIGFRFFGPANLARVTAWSIDVDYADRFGLIAETGNPRRIVAHAAYIRSSPERAEVAFLVADDWQGRGISTIMLAHLAAAAHQHGITAMFAEVLPANHRMIEVFRESGFPIETRSTPDAIEIEFPTSMSADAVARFEERGRTAAVAAVQRFLAPRSVALVGASGRRGTIGGELLHNIITGDFKGPIYPVNPHVDVLRSLTVFRTVGEIPAAVDLAVVAVPAPLVVAVARECAEAKVRALLVISAGFAEAGEDGRRRQEELVAVCRESGLRLVGPNCLGVLNTAPDVSLNATFAPGRAIAGRVGLLSQSGGLGIALIDATARLGVGLSSFVSVGNKADLSGNDLLQYWEQDPGTDLALLYLESFGNPRKFARVARRFARRKPILAVKSGRSAAGARATSSHTGTLLAASNVTVEALFHQAGVIRTDTLHELFDVAALLAKQPIPRGDRIAIVTNGGGPGIICADAARANGAQVPALVGAVAGELTRLLPNAASLRNPIDLTASASAEDYRHALRTLVATDACDAIVAIFVPPLVAAADVATAISEVAQECGECTLATVFMTGERPPDQLGSGRVQVPGYEFPEDAARAVALAARHGLWRAGPEGTFLVLDDCRPDEAAAVISEQLGGGGSAWLAREPVAALMRCYGLPLAPTQRVGAAAPPGVPLIVGVVHDHSFGPVLACGAAGAAAELVTDVVVRITPVTDVDAREMIRSLKTFPLLDGYRGTVPCDLAALEDVLQRVSAMVQAHPEIAELDCNPLIAGPAGVVIGDARIRVAATVAPPPLPSLKA